MTLWRYLNAIKANRTSGLRMKYKHLLFLTILWSGAQTAAAQSGSIVGTLALTAADKLLPDGARTSDFGDNPHGLVIFTADATTLLRFIAQTAQSFLPMIGPKYPRRSISFQIDRASWPNWDDTVQVRTYELKGDELS
jgi:hypothetical protein